MIACKESSRYENTFVCMEYLSEQIKCEFYERESSVDIVCRHREFGCCQNELCQAEAKLATALEKI